MILATPVPPALLFHYTTPTGLLGILNGRKIWATHTRFLNDAQKLDYGLCFIREVLSTYPCNDLLADTSNHLDVRPQVLVWKQACYDKVPSSVRYTQVQIFCGDEVIADIPVEDVQLRAGAASAKAVQWLGLCRDIAVELGRYSPVGSAAELHRIVHSGTRKDKETKYLHGSSVWRLAIMRRYRGAMNSSRCLPDTKVDGRAAVDA